MTNDFGLPMVSGAAVAKVTDVKNGAIGDFAYGFKAYYKPAMVEKRNAQKAVVRDAFDAYLLSKP